MALWHSQLLNIKFNIWVHVASKGRAPSPTLERFARSIFWPLSQTLVYTLFYRVQFTFALQSVYNNSIYAQMLKDTLIMRK